MDEVGPSQGWGDPVRAWLATVAGTSASPAEAAAASLLLSTRLKQTGMFPEDVAQQVLKTFRWLATDFWE